jgi:aspartyl/asparaginyl-tRNA synthetase
MTEFTIARAAEFDGQEVELHGWLYNKRESGKLIFPIFRDGTGLMQAVVSKAEVSPCSATWRLCKASRWTTPIRFPSRTTGSISCSVTAGSPAARAP